MSQTSGISSTAGLPDVGPVPRHVAIIMDGNGRWATQRKLPRVAGHAKGVEAVRTIVEACARQGVEYLTLFAFSSENWRRPRRRGLGADAPVPDGAQARGLAAGQTTASACAWSAICRRSTRSCSELIEKAELRTEANRRMTLTIAANYGGRWDILQAVRAMLRVRPELAGAPEAIDEAAFAGHLAMAHAPEPDLFVRTGGEQRISNFLLWQLAYTELYFTDTYWPDFDAAELQRAIDSYRQRERRFGRTSAQVSTAA